MWRVTINPSRDGQSSAPVHTPGRIVRLCVQSQYVGKMVRHRSPRDRGTPAGSDEFDVV